MKRLIALIIVAMAFVPACYAWSKKGHQVIAYIAKRHLTSRTYAAVDSILDGNSLVYWASWLDGVRDDPRYSFTTTWHYINVEAGKTVDDRYYEPDGDAIHAIEVTVDGLSESDTSISEKELGLKILVHVVGDLHQPLHAGHKSDYGGNSIYLTFIGDGTNLHSMWDYYIVEAAHPWSYYEWTEKIDNLTKEQEAEAIKGDVYEWASQSVDVAAEIYDSFPRYCKVTANDVIAWTPTIETQFMKGGLRLAHMLNSVFDPEYVASMGVDDIFIDEDVENGPADVYSIDGKRVKSGATIEDALKNLAPGLYISRGRKYVVR